MIIEFSNRQSKFKVMAWRALLEQVLPRALAGSQEDSGLVFPVQPAVFLMLAGPMVMRRINQELRQVDRVTDVLSFPQLAMKNGQLLAPLSAQDFEVKASGEKTLPLGDIVICPAVAASQAADYGHSVERELAFLAEHGLLHLLGYDHAEKTGEKLMLRLPEEILDSMGLERS